MSSATNLLAMLDTAPWWCSLITGVLCLIAAILCLSVTHKVEGKISRTKSAGCVSLIVVLVAILAGGFGFVALLKAFLGVP